MHLSLDKLSPFGVLLFLCVIYCKNISLMGGGVVHENESPCSEGEAIDGLAFLPGSDMNWIDPPMGESKVGQRRPRANS